VRNSQTLQTEGVAGSTGQQCGRHVILEVLLDRVGVGGWGRGFVLGVSGRGLIVAPRVGLRSLYWERVGRREDEERNDEGREDERRKKRKGKKVID
jgi:hypothetical protein